jgi:predicted HTH domain antitoxin
MDDVTLQLTLPKQVLLSLGLSGDDAIRAVKKFLVLQLVRDGRISTGKGAELLNLAKYEFVELMATEGLPYFNYTPEEIAEELKNVNG